MTTKPFDYQRYLASRAWGLLREAVRVRSDNSCEHCFIAPQQAVHHLTYENIGHETLADLLAVCNLCHEFLSGKAQENPLDEFGVVGERLKIRFGSGDLGHYIIPFHLSGVAQQLRSVNCLGSGCIWCSYADPYWGFFLWDAFIPPSPES